MAYLCTCKPKTNKTMNATQAKHYLLSFPEKVFIEWYNDRIIDPFGDFSFATIEENTPEKFWEVVTKNLDPEAFISIAQKGNYAECDKYFYIADEVRSFDSVEALLEGKEAEYIISMFLENEEDERAILEEERAKYVEE